MLFCQQQSVIGYVQVVSVKQLLNWYKKLNFSYKVSDYLLSKKIQRISKVVPRSNVVFRMVGKRDD